MHDTWETITESSLLLKIRFKRTMKGYQNQVTIDTTLPIPISGVLNAAFKKAKSEEKKHLAYFGIELFS